MLFAIDVTPRVVSCCLYPDTLVQCACLYPQFLTQDTLYRFPYFTTYSLDYSADAVKMLGQLCTAVLLHPDVKEHITKLVTVAGDAKGASSGPAAK
jgi:hypothetical protein